RPRWERPGGRPRCNYTCASSDAERRGPRVNRPIRRNGGQGDLGASARIGATLFPSENPMARITVEDCLKQIPNRFQLALAAAYRARQLAQGHTPKIDTKD